MDEADLIARTITSTPEGEAAARQVSEKHGALTAFQVEHGLADELVEASMKECMVKNDWDWHNWDLETVKSICLRNKDSGIPHEYLPEETKRRADASTKSIISHG